ncbi:hypothetical protein IRY44_10580 [Micromonospora sp. ANENR4]|uniref:hypothetical protein n=1 Tax=Micromonospora sp. ANENR4 TaxID=2783662 RepID=UPI00188EA309|nr:hypothetical protein [Micromonospora sp. ANENR4]MBF5030190.1 hypothetical protein [Micromonospora sp. ANENR4]
MTQGHPPPGHADPRYGVSPPAQPVPWAPPPPAPKSRRGLWIGLAAGALALAVCAGTAVGVGLGLRGNDEDAPAPKAAAGANGVTVTNAELAGLLDRHSKALAAKDLDGYLAAFDPARKDLIAGQTQLFRNLMKLPLSVARYETVEQQGRVSDAFGQGVTFQLDVSFVHQLDGFDRAPVSEWYRWTIVRAGKDAPIRVVAVTGAPAGGNGDSKTVYYPGPWDKWRDIHVERTPYALIITDAARGDLARRYAPAVDKAVTSNLAVWRANAPPEPMTDKFVVTLADGKDEMTSLYRIGTEKATEAGISLGMVAAERKDGKATIGGTRIVVDTTDSYFTRSGGDNDARMVLRHEIAHSLMTPRTDLTAVDEFSKLDEWVVEGFAEYVAFHGRPLGASERTAQARKLVRDGWNGTLPGNGDWDDPGRLSFHYWLGHAAMNHLAEKHGEPKLFRFVEAVYAGTPTDRAARDVLGVSLDEFQAGWADYVRAQAR